MLSENCELKSPDVVQIYSNGTPVLATVQSVEADGDRVKVPVALHTTGEIVEIVDARTATTSVLMKVIR